METIQIDLPGHDYQYSVLVGNKILASALEKILSGYANSKVFLITNDTIQNLYHEMIDTLFMNRANVKMKVLPDGEKYKNQDTVNSIHDFLAVEKANRGSILISLGGGVLGDMVGFAAATFMRGIAYIQIPTTLLSQVDSSVGGKTGINHSAGKNLVGAFKQPLQTIIDVDFMNTLPDREFISGYGELIKHGFIRDVDLFKLLVESDWRKLKADPELLVDVVFRSCNVKAGVVIADEKESNLRAILNFGHTLGHFIETLTNYVKFSHGEAVIIGMDFASWWSVQEGYLSEEAYQLIHNHLNSLGISRSIPEVSKTQFQTIIEHDKKALEEGIRFIGLKAIGDADIFDKTTSESLWNRFQSFTKTGALTMSDE